MFQQREVQKNSIQSLTLSLRHQVVKSSGIALGTTCVIGVIVRNWIAPMRPHSFYIALGVGIGFWSVPLLQRKLSNFWCSFLMILGLTVLTVNAGMSNGGLRAPIVSTAIIIPVYGFISSGRKGAHIGALMATLSIVFLVYAEHAGIALPLNHTEKFIYYKSVMLFGLMVGTYLMGSLYERFRERSEETLLQISSELSIANKFSSLGEMASGVSHEINNPLSVVIARVQSLRKKIESGQELNLESLKENLQGIEDNAIRISKIIQSMKRLSADLEPEGKVVVPVSLIISDVLDFYRERLKNHGVEFRLVDEVGALEIECHPTLITQVLMNLLGNAEDAIEGLPQRWIEMRVEAQQDYLKISVIDSGQGISKDVAQKIMQPFFTTKPVGKGTGLGLSISKGIVEKHLGEFTYNASSPNTRFEVKLPLKA